MKKSPPKFFAAWMAQATWCSLITLPVLAVNGIPASAFARLSGVRATDALGLALWAGGFAFEAVADRQKSTWVKDKKAKVHDEEFMTKGLWKRW